MNINKLNDIRDRIDLARTYYGPTFEDGDRAVVRIVKDQDLEALYLEVLALSARLAEVEAELGKWRGWAQFVFNGGGQVSGADDELRAMVCERYDKDRAVDEPCTNCGHAAVHDGPSGDVPDACTHPVCECGFDSRGVDAERLMAYADVKDHKAERGEVVKACPTSGVELIASERASQVDKCGWTADHDDEHSHTELITAAMSYAAYASSQIRKQPLQYLAIESRWPFEWSAWRPDEDPINNLVKAGALIAAEIDRLQRVKP